MFEKFLPFLTPIFIAVLGFYILRNKNRLDAQTLSDNLVLKWRDEVLTISAKLIEEQKKSHKLELELQQVKDKCQCQPAPALLEVITTEPKLLNA